MIGAKVNDQEITQALLLALQFVKLIHDAYMHRTLQTNNTILERNHQRIKDLYCNAIVCFPCDNQMNEQLGGSGNG